MESIYAEAADRLLRAAARGPARHQSIAAADSPEGRMKPVNLAAQLAAAETQLTCLKLMLAQVKEAELRREAEKLIAMKLSEVDEPRFAPLERRPSWWRRRATG